MLNSFPAGKTAAIKSHKLVVIYSYGLASLVSRLGLELRPTNTSYQPLRSHLGFGCLGQLGDLGSAPVPEASVTV